MAEPKNIYAKGFYYGENKGTLKVAQRQNRYKSNVWITVNQTLNPGKGNYWAYGITINEGAEPMTITKINNKKDWLGNIVETKEIKTKVFNIDQTNLKEVYPKSYEYLCQQAKAKNRKRYVSLSNERYPRKTFARWINS